jgi:hypothetical protein
MARRKKSVTFDIDLWLGLFDNSSPWARKDTPPTKFAFVLYKR